MDLIKTIRNVPNFPIEGIQFKDISTLLQNPEAFKYSIDQLAEKFKDLGATTIVGAESRGFIFGAALAYKMGISFSMIRKPGKLPYKTISETYELEYGTDTIEMHIDGVKKGEKVLVIDDLLATGGTIEACIKLVEKTGGIVVGVGFVIELTGSLHGRDKLKNYNVISLVEIPVEE
ncbi:MAG: adenine phosphoribosyltransferase [archaeon]|nr:adenine phosphoribosyltransferase [archaeon]